MKTLYIEAGKKDLGIDLSNHDFSKLPKRVGLIYTIQFRPFIEDLQNALRKAGKKVFLSKGFRGEHPGQVLGCDAGAAIYIIDKVDCFLFLSSGKWHAQRIALSLPKSKPFYIINAEGVEMIDSEKLKKARTVLQKKFYFSERFGIIVSAKPGQENLKSAMSLKKDLEKSGKSAEIFISDMINPLEFENFKVDMWINTACPGLAFDFPNMINLEELKFLKF